MACDSISTANLDRSPCLPVVPEVFPPEQRGSDDGQMATLLTSNSVRRYHTDARILLRGI